MINFEWYRTFKAIYRTGTLTGAAQELLISQPNVSQHLSALEAYIRHPLFERKPRQMVPTDYGKLFYTQIVEAVEKLENVEADFRSICEQQIPLTCVGAPKEFFNAVMAEKVSKAPGNLIFEFDHTRQLMEKVVRGDIYFAVSTSAGNEPGIVYEPVLDEKFVLVGSPDLDTAALKRAINKGEMDKAEQWLNEQTWFAYSSDLSVIRRFWLENFRKRPAIRPRFVIPDYSGILKAVSAGSGVAIAADYLVKELVKQKKLKEIWAGVKPTCNTLYLAYDKAKVTSVQVKMVKALLKG
ncbi:LysR family transcriptional regulator [Chitinophaga solisilvae]|uniref:LysR family transcriptional regulator n=1 Tax=Chitinophaga solisilvae TaxID=1233460 RepID=A0A433WQ71_9BACT|nr:LysR family transcriptional regulator [Chitinophaga solisilvae]NSL86922.1 LysR family transcriptional regulator [Chitinophaga solisilvae]